MHVPAPEADSADEGKLATRSRVCVSPASSDWMRVFLYAVHKGCYCKEFYPGSPLCEAIPTVRQANAKKGGAVETPAVLCKGCGFQSCLYFKLQGATSSNLLAILSEKSACPFF